MLVEQLSIAYKCHSSIGNSVDLKEMIHEVLKTFVSETYAIYAEFCLFDKDKNLLEYDKFGKISNFNSSNYLISKEPVSFIIEDEFKVLRMTLDNGVIFLVSKNLNDECAFFISMFESFLPKLNLSVNACINYEKLNNSYKLLQEQKKELIKANKTKDDFLANMSHELKTPLNSIIVISSIMSKNKDLKLDLQQVKNMQIIKKCADDLLDLINDILDISKIEAGQLNIRKEDINLKLLINELYDAFEPLAKEKNLEFINSFNLDNPIVYGDEIRFKQIIKNLLSNAIKFTNEGKIEILTKESEDYIEISIIDSGIGITKENLKNVFDRFKQIDDSRTRKYKGTGLGLTISKELALMLNGDLSCSSELNNGSTFIFKIAKKDNLKIACLLDEHSIKKEIVEKEPKTHIIMIHSNGLEQFNLTILLRKNDLDITPVASIDKLKSKISSSSSKNIILLVDERVENISDLMLDSFYKDFKKILLCKDNPKIKDSIYTLDYDLKNEDLVEKVVKFLKDI